MEDDLFDDDEDSWELMRRALSLKSIFLFCDLNRVISSARDDRKKTLTVLANRLFYYMEELGNAVKIRSVSQTQVHYIALHRHGARATSSDGCSSYSSSIALEKGRKEDMMSFMISYLIFFPCLRER